MNVFQIIVIIFACLGGFVMILIEAKQEKDQKKKEDVEHLIALNSLSNKVRRDE